MWFFSSIIVVVIMIVVVISSLFTTANRKQSYSHQNLLSQSYCQTIIGNCTVLFTVHCSLTLSNIFFFLTPSLYSVCLYFCYLIEEMFNVVVHSLPLSQRQKLCWWSQCDKGKHFRFIRLESSEQINMPYDNKLDHINNNQLHFV